MQVLLILYQMLSSQLIQEQHFLRTKKMYQNPVFHLCLQEGHFKHSIPQKTSEDRIFRWYFTNPTASQFPRKTAYYMSLLEI